MPLTHHLKGPFHFLDPTTEEIHQLFPETLPTLPPPQAIFLDDENHKPLVGFPVLESEGMAELRGALSRYLAAEEDAQLAIYRRHPFERRTHDQAWQGYRSLLAQAIENSTMSSYGRHYPVLFWLFHSLDITHRLMEVPGRLLRADAALGKEHRYHVKYRVFDKLLDRLRTTAYDSVARIATNASEFEEDLFPKLLTRMFDNVLIFTEDRVSDSLSELRAYFDGHLGIDGKDFLARWHRMRTWTTGQLERSDDIRNACRHLLKVDVEASSADLFKRPGFVPYLASSKGYDPKALLSEPMVRMWESLLVKLKEFELMNALRRLILPVQDEGEHLVFKATGLAPAWQGQRRIHVSSSTRPLDFMSPWVIDPMIQRCGLIYDISEFSKTITMLRRSGNEAKELAFRLIFRFQRQVQRLAARYGLKFEKYLGDGAFYTSRSATRIVVGAIHMQRYYKQAVREGLPFDRGMRIGINFSHYRLIPISTTDAGRLDRYEFFGQGVVELTRLTSGKGSRELDEIQNFLISYGYPRSTVMRFFEPLVQRNLDVVDKDAVAYGFYVYLNRNGNLVNEGIAASAELIAELGRELETVPFYRARLGSRWYVAFALEDGADDVVIGIRKLGTAHLKGLDDITVYEVVDGDRFEGALEPVEEGGLLLALERSFAVSRPPTPA